MIDYQVPEITEADFERLGLFDVQPTTLKESLVVNHVAVFNPRAKRDTFTTTVSFVADDPNEAEGQLVFGGGFWHDSGDQINLEQLVSDMIESVRDNANTLGPTYDPQRMLGFGQYSMGGSGILPGTTIHTTPTPSTANMRAETVESVSPFRFYATNKHVRSGRGDHIPSWVMAEALEFGLIPLPNPITMHNGRFDHDYWSHFKINSRWGQGVVDLASLASKGAKNWAKLYGFETLEDAYTNAAEGEPTMRPDQNDPLRLSNSSSLYEGRRWSLVDLPSDLIDILGDQPVKSSLERMSEYVYVTGISKLSARELQSLAAEAAKHPPFIRMGVDNKTLEEVVS